MNSRKRTTVYLEPVLHRALRLKAAATDRTFSELVNEAMKVALAEDVEDLRAFAERKNERTFTFDVVAQGLKRLAPRT